MNCSSTVHTLVLGSHVVSVFLVLASTLLKLNYFLVDDTAPIKIGILY